MKTTLLLLALLISPLLLAETAADSTSQMDEPFKPAQQLRVGIERLLTFMQQQPAPDNAQIARFLDTEIAPFFGFAEMARLAAGRFYANLSKDKQVRMETEMKRMLLTRLTQALMSYRQPQIRYRSPRVTQDGRTAYITVLMIGETQYPARVDFRMQRGSNHWVITDVAANGHSVVMYYRRELAKRFTREMYQAMGGMR